MSEESTSLSARSCRTRYMTSTEAVVVAAGLEETEPEVVSVRMAKQLLGFGALASLQMEMQVPMCQIGP